MPLIELWLQPAYRAKTKTRGPDVPTRELIQWHFANALPWLFVENAEELGLAPDTPQQGVQVTNHEYSRSDVNPANIWLDIRFSEARPDEARCMEIRDNLYALFQSWFNERDIELENLVMDLAWGPTHGKGTVDGVEIQW